VPDARVQERGSTFEPHNIYLLVVIELGVLGLLLTLAGLGTALTGALRLPEAMRGPPVAALLGTMVSSFFLSNLEFKFFWAVLAYAAISVTVAAGERAAGAATLPPVVRRFAVTGQGGH
jgi:O-antigen ligase